MGEEGARTLSDLKDLVYHYLHNETERQRIARAGHEHFIGYHSAEKRATYFFDVCNHWAA